jgi:type I restriction enzyme M protein
MLTHGASDKRFSSRPRLDIFWLNDESLEASDNLPNPDVIVQEIVADLESALEQVRLIANDLKSVDEEIR